MFSIVSNLRLPARWERSGVSGTSLYASSCGEILRQLRNSDLVIINGLEMTLKLCELFAVAPWLRRPLVAVDVVLRKPESVKSWLSAAMTRQLLRKVDYFLHYFRDLSGYRKYFDVGPERSGYVPFKPNLRYRVEAKPDADGEYVLCLGYSMRDYKTFFKAVGKLGYPAAIAAPNFAELCRHYSRFPRSLSEVPANVRLLADDGSQESLVRMLRGAKMVVLPIVKSSLCASGIGICLNSMFLGKCVLISRGPGASDVLTHQALFFEPEDTHDLAAEIRRAWDGEELRNTTAACGHAYALSLGGEPELYERVLTAAVQWHAHKRCSRKTLVALQSQ
ncbi:MAG: glycosyltransferase [Terriglobales bacterium]|jgi:glycosyltransferase involved in cell wall biosynthesis